MDFKVYTLIKLFFIGSLGGWIYEYIINRHANYNLGLNIPFLFIYGIGIIITYMIYYSIKDQDALIRAFIYAFVLTALEYFIGILSYQYYGYHTWMYENGMKISLESALMWTLMALLSESIFTWIDKQQKNDALKI